MVTKELGAWYGSDDYYGKGNRYLWLDGHIWNGLSMAMSWPGSDPCASYHDIGDLHGILQQLWPWHDERIVSGSCQRFLMTKVYTFSGHF